MKEIKLILVITLLLVIPCLFAQTPYEVNVRFVETNSGLDFIDVSSIQFEVELDPPSGDIQIGPSSLCFVSIEDIGAGSPHSFIQFDLENFAGSYVQTSNIRVTIWDGNNILGAGETVFNKENDLDPASGFMGWNDFFGVGGNPLYVESDDSFPPVIISDFSTAVFENEFVQISWTTESSTNMNLWILYREDVIIYTEAAVNGTEPHTYIYEDTDVIVGETYTYYLEAVENDGTTTMYGPVSATMIGQEIPPVTLSSFFAVYSNDLLTINWTTESELNNLGWNIYRSLSNNLGQSLLINSNLIPGAGSTSEPTEYSFQDAYVENNTTYWYWLESVDYSGTTLQYGPVTLTVQFEEIPVLPTETRLKRIYPNPFN